jgi:hypothetical protein
MRLIVVLQSRPLRTSVVLAIPRLGEQELDRNGIALRRVSDP